MADPGRRSTAPPRQPGHAPAPLDGAWLRRALAGARDGLDAEVDAINDLNVFPVPDGDTGSNLLHTVSAACEALAALTADADLSQVGRAAAQGSLMGARGNSGVIVSQLLRGFAQGMDGSAAAAPDRLADGLAAAARVAQRAVMRPKTGTILTVADEAARAGREASGRERTSGPAVLAAAAEAAWSAVERTPSQLPVLAEAGVVDAGGYGLAVMLSAFAQAAGARTIRRPAHVLGVDGGRDRPRTGAGRAAATGVLRGAAAVTAPEGGYGYCTEFHVQGGRDDAEAVRSRLERAGDLGDSALIVGDPGLVHVHVHTPEPWRILTAAAELGRIERLSVRDMTEQHRQAQARLRPPTATGATVPNAVSVVAVAPGPGFQAILLDLGAAAVVLGGPTQHPSTEDLVEGIRLAGGRGAIILPNHPDVLLTAKQAERMALGRAQVVASRSVPQGIAALLALDPDLDLAANRERMERAMAGVHTIEVTTAVRDSRQDGQQIRRGSWLAVLDGRIVATGEQPAAVVLAALATIGPESLELVTLYRGADATAADLAALADAIRERHPHLEVERQEGGQPLYPFVISAE